MKKYAVLSLSGGMDSSTLLIHLLSKNYDVLALSFDYGQKHQTELFRAKSLIKYLKNNKLNVHHEVITIGGISKILDSNLVKGGDDVPEGHYSEDNMKLTVVPNRNKIFASIIQAAALSLKQKSPQSEVVIAMGIHAGDHAVYPDCRAEFRKADLKAFHVGNWDADKIDYYTPYLKGDKLDILKDGLKCCEQLNIDFDTVYKHTMTSYKPIKRHDYVFSDFKSASSVERIEAFINLGRKDPLRYANEKGKEVSWNYVVKEVEKVLNTHKEKIKKNEPSKEN